MVKVDGNATRKDLAKAVSHLNETVARLLDQIRNGRN